MRFDFLYVTAASGEQARSMGRKLVEERLAACVNIFDNMNSLYWWDGRIEHGQEAVLIVKTRDSLVEDVIARVKELHSYTCPCVVALRVARGSADYLQWLARETRPRVKEPKRGPKRRRGRTVARKSRTARRKSGTGKTTK